MPTLLLLYGFRFFFYSNEGNEPPHIHVVKGNSNGKIWLEPDIAIAYLHGFNASEGKQIREITMEHAGIFKNKWHEYFGK